jgi:autotransporter-associated beta strand protein
VQRNGTAVTSDVLAIAAGSGYTVSGSNLQAGGLTFATFTSANGVLTITFANPGAGGTDATNALVQDVLRKISYQNDTPAGNATLRFSLADGTNSSTTDVTVTTDKIYVTAATDTAVDNLNDGVSFSEALRLANAQTGTETLVLQADLANQTVGAANVASLTGSVIVDADAASGATISSGTLNTNGQILTVTNGSGDTLTVATTLSGTGNLAKTGAGAAILTGTNTYSGTTAVTGGKITANGSSSLGTSAVTLDSGTLGFGATNDWTIANAITLGAGGGTLESSAGNNSGVTTVSGVLSGGNLTLTNGSGAQIGLVKLTGTNTYTGTTTLALTPSGLVQINGDENLGGGNIIFNNGKLGILSDTVIDNNIQTSGASATFSIASGTTTEIAGVISGNRDLSSEGNGGTLKLSGINTYTGSTRVGNTLIASSDAALPDGTLLELGGTLTLLSNQTVGALNSFYGPLSTSVINLDTHTLTLGGNNASNFAGAINGSGNLVKNGAGTFVVTSTTARANEGNHSGNITINGGVLQLDGTLKGAINVASGGKLTGGGADATAGDALDNVSVASGGTLSPGGSGGIATADIKTGNLSIASGATLAMNISGTNAGATSSGYDQIITTGTVDVTDATLTMIGSYNAVVGDSFVLVSNDSNDAVTGTFNGLAEGAIVTVNGTPMKLSYVGGTGNDITLTAQMTFSGLAISADTGSVTTDFITNTAAQTISATLSSALGSTGVTIWGSVDNGVNWTNVTTMVSDTTLTWTGESLSGTSTLKLEARNASSAVVGSTSQAYELDTTAPGTTIATKAFSADTGTSSTDFITKTAAQTISGTLSAITVAGETVQVSLDNGSTWVDATNTTGENTWSLAGQTLTASNTLKVRVADTAGNTGTEASQAYVLDQGAPTNTFSALGISADTGISTTDFKTSTAGQTITATLSGPVVGTDKVWGSTNNGSTWTDVTAMVSGTTLTWTGATLSGSSTIKLKVSDDAGNDGTVASVAYVLDTAVPTASVTTANVGIGSNVTTSQSTETGIIYLVQSTATPVSYAQLESLLTAPAAATKATVTTINTNTALGTTGLTAGTYKVYAVDAAGNISAASANTITLGAPPTTVANAASLSDDTGISNTDLITQTAAQTISGTLSAVTVAGETIQVSLDNGSNWVNATNTIGESTWTLAGQTLAGSNTLQVRVTNVAGFSNSPYTHTYSIDTTAPTTTVASKAFSNDTGTSNTDFITKTAAQTISGTLSANMVAGEIVQVSLDNGSTWTTATTTPGQNTWSLAGQTLTGNDTLKVRVTDTAGNTGTEASQTYTLDQTGPAITFSTLSISADTGASTTDFITQTAAQTISATLSGAPAGTDIVYGSLDNGATWTDITNKVSGTTLTWDGVSLTGSGTLKLKVTDLAGSDGTISSQVYVLDTTAPTFNPGAGTPADNATSVSTTAPIVVHFSEPLHSSSVLGQVYLKTVANDGGVPATVTLSGNGDVVITPLAPLSNSTAYYVSWDANALKDAAGNVGTAVADQTTLNFTTAAVVIPPPDPTPTPTPPNVNDSDNVPAAVENQTPSLPNAGGTTVTGDGNGDGVADSAQSNVTSTSFLKTGQVTTDTTAQVTFVSLVADSKDGAIDTTDTTNAVLTNIVQNDAPANLPAGITMPLGLISFTATVGTSSTATGSAPGVGINETFSLFVDASLGVNGYWKQNAAGTWVNLASDVHGGNLVTVGNRMRLDFQIQDGGEFDADGKVDGIITDPGAAGYLPQSLLSHIPELPQDSFWF